jgi:hypothetical protein
MVQDDIIGSTCVPGLGTVLAMYPHEFVISPFIASAVTRAGIGDPTTILMLVHSAVGVVEATRTMGAQGVSAQEHVYWCQVYSKHEYLVVIPQSGWGRSTLGKAWRPMDTASRQRRLPPHAVQTDCGIESDFSNHDECGERLVGLGVRVEKEGEGETA